MDLGLLNSKYRKYIKVNSTANVLGKQKCLIILGLYVLSGCDQVVIFHSVTKAQALTVYLSSPTEPVKSLSQLGNDMQQVTDDVLKGVYCILIYCTPRRSKTDAVSKFTDTGERLFSKIQPPTPEVPGA